MTIYTFIFFCAGNLHCFICGVVCYKNNCLNGGVDTIRIIKRLRCNISLVVLLELYELMSLVATFFYSFRSKVKCAYKPSDALRPWQTRTHCCGHIVADTNVSSFSRARNICCGHKFCVRDTKMFPMLFRNILCPQQTFPSLRSPRNIMGNNVSATMCPRLPGPLGRRRFQ